MDNWYSFKLFTMLEWKNFNSFTFCITVATIWNTWQKIGFFLKRSQSSLWVILLCCSDCGIFFYDFSFLLFKPISILVLNCFLFYASNMPVSVMHFNLWSFHSILRHNIAYPWKVLEEVWFSSRKTSLKMENSSNRISTIFQVAAKKNDLCIIFIICLFLFYARFHTRSWMFTRVCSASAATVCLAIRKLFDLSVSWTGDRMNDATDKQWLNLTSSFSVKNILSEKVG